MRGAPLSRLWTVDHGTCMRSTPDRTLNVFGKEGKGDLMSIPTFVRWSLILTATTASLVVFAWAQTPTPAKPLTDAKPISVESLEKQLPVGHLGVPLGTVVRVTGEAFDGDTTKEKAYSGKTFLRVATVNGKELAESVVFEFLHAADSVKKPAPGDKFDYYVHEYGEFDGLVTPPKELGINMPLMAGTVFGYRRHLTVHASNSERK
jgi:hypothetical protein